MSSKIESAARTLATLIATNEVTDNDLKIFAQAVKNNNLDPDGKKEDYRQAAKAYHSQGDLEFDSDNTVSLSENGAYVQCWKYISKEEI